MAYINPNPEIKDEKETINTQESDYKEINEVYFAFIDVLGFKKTFDDIKVNKLVTAEKYRDVFNYYFELMNSSKLMDREKNTGCYSFTQLSLSHVST